MAKLAAHGKYLFENGRKYFARGVSYGPFAPNSRGERYPERERVAADFAEMRELGANLVRVYVAPPPWLCEEAMRAGLRLMVGIPWPFHMAFLDSRGMQRDIRNSIRDGVARMREFDEAVFAFSLGNEIRSDIVRWHGPRAVSRFLAELYDIGKSIAPEALFTYSNYPSAEYLELGFLDFVSFNVYLHDEPDYRRYLTHLLASTGEQPVVLSETGIDTIRNGEERQADVLAWQARAAFELGLSGLVVFAFTDEWHTGGAEITEWAFGLVTRERKRKLAFAAVADEFRRDLPPPLTSAPRATVAVCAYNAAASLGACLDSLASLNYPDYETLVVDDGSSDDTARIAESAGVRVVRKLHDGLGAARNAALEAASGDVIAYIDADACAERDWLYHLVEALQRNAAAAAGGPNFAPTGANGALARALAAAPGLPREVRAGDDRLAQLCGCNMALKKSSLQALGGFDPMFTAAGDDVDVSWRLTERGATLAAAPGAVVIHERRSSIRAYLRQQIGYGTGEGLLYRKYPYRASDLYGSQSILESLLGRARIYYGAYGRGLFQSLYPGRELPPLAQLPLTAPWVLASVLLVIAGEAGAMFRALGELGLFATLAGAGIGAARAELRRGADSVAARLWLVVLFAAGPVARSFARERAKWFAATRAPEILRTARSGFEPAGTILLESPPAGDGAERAIDSARAIQAMRAALLARGFAVAASDGFQEYDLEVVLPPCVRVPLNAIRRRDARLALRWRLRVAPKNALLAGAAGFVVLAVAGLGAGEAAVAVVLAELAAAALALARTWRLPAVIGDAALDAARKLGLRVIENGGGA